MESERVREVSLDDHYLVLVWPENVFSVSDSVMFNFECVLHRTKSESDITHPSSPSDLKKKYET